MYFEDLQETHYLIQGGRSSCKTYLMKLQADKEQLQQENKILKENTENNDKLVVKVNWENMLLKKENQELKKQLEEILSKYLEIIGGKNDKK